MIYAERIRQARELAGLTQSEIARKVRVGQSTIAHIETGRSLPSYNLLEDIAKATQVQPSFFEQAPPPDLPLGSLAYRARKSLRAIERDKAHEYARLCIEQFSRMATSLNFPRLVGCLTSEDPKIAAMETRALLDLDPDKPIPNLINAIERKGFLVAALPFELERLDAFSLWALIDQERPVIIVSSGKTGDRLRFSVAHEVGHIMLHKGVRGDYAVMEKEANLFAGELLLPERSMRQLLTSDFTLTRAAHLKLRWGVSMQLLIKRAADLGIISERRYRYLFEQIGARGWRKREPDNLDIPLERPRAFKKMVELCYGSLLDYQRLAAAMHISHRHAQAILKEYALGLTSATLEGTEEYIYPEHGLSTN